MKSGFARCRAETPRERRNFTLIELLIVIALVAILASLLLPALNKSKATAQTVGCESNLRQLQLGWHMYADENKDALPMTLLDNQQYGAYNLDYARPGSWVVGNRLVDSSPTNLQSGTLYPYVKGVGIYRCPADRQTVYRLDATLTTTPVIFSYGINHPLNASGLWSLAVYPAPYKYARKSSELVVPGPSQTWVFTEPWSGFTAPTFGFYITQNRLWGHLPTDRHSLGANFSFADGHTQRRHWKAPKETRSSDVIQPGGDRDDYTWLIAGLPELP